MVACAEGSRNPGPDPPKLGQSITAFTPCQKHEVSPHFVPPEASNAVSSSDQSMTLTHRFRRALWVFTQADFLTLASQILTPNGEHQGNGPVRSWRRIKILMLRHLRHQGVPC